MTYDYLILDADSGTPLYQQLYLTMKASIEAGHLAKGERLPSIRRLAEDLKLSCTTVENAYQQLCVEGYIQSRPQRGYFVLTAAHDDVRRKPRRVGTLPAYAPAIRYNFGSDCVDSDNIDIKVWRRHIREVLNRQEVIAGYGEHQGEYALREALSAYTYSVRGVVASPEQIVIGAGTQPLLTILCGLLNGHDTRVAMEEPGFLQAEQIFSDCGLSVLHLPADESGIRMDALKESGVKLLFVSPSNRIQTGASLPMGRRFELLSWAKETGGIIIEDDYNGELRYNARPIPAMQSMAGSESIVYIGSFSKLLLPSVRIGYMVLPEPLLERYLARASRYNQTASKIEQLALSGYIKSGQLERHLRRLRKLYAAKSTALMKALKNAFGGRMEILLEETLLYLILDYKTEKTSQELCALAAENGVRTMPPQDGTHRVRLGFAGIPIREIGAAVECLKSAWYS
ncbi:MocR-like pyridoxine biosynthesis transcription factor PdxR [Caproiciproducens faecalis]|uniref:PLP-dependent aminotransferase family protein n=1 Tax=Caproiciproducens faecalis TaxID=2820301 RepID=A0ABS7DRE6_9FIRM|nr:PLP-dependent aminotransferase family protein [Caproiciproducens faecalis]MBW7573870.1 PLP-dependent aminotransferase family protein [Caproiciproducens faecalis]